MISWTESGERTDGRTQENGMLGNGWRQKVKHLDLFLQRVQMLDNAGASVRARAKAGPLEERGDCW